MHARTAIRNAVAELMRATSTAGGHVYPSRLFSLEEADLPSISVYTTDDSNAETVTNITLGKPPRLHRELPVVIEAHAVMDEAIDDTLDQLALEIEQAMSQVLIVLGKAVPTRLVSTQTTFSGEGDLQVGVIRLLYSLAYSTREDTPDSLS